MITWKDVVICLLLAAMAAGWYFSRQATERINQRLHDADSVNTATKARYKAQLERSRLVDSANAELQKQRDKATKSADIARDSSKVLKDKLAKALTPADTIRVLTLTVVQKNVEISSLRSRIYVDSLNILSITRDRDNWKTIADSLQRANTRIYRDAADIAAAAKHEVNLGILRVPREVVTAGLTGALGFGIGRISSH